MSTLSITELSRVRTTFARALSAEDVSQLGRTTGQAVQLAPDCDAERPFLPEPATLTGCLLLADRGYPSVPYFEAVREAGAAFIGRRTAGPSSDAE